jgi:hypothetical protein
VLCDNDPKFVLYRVAQRFGLPVVPEWADWFNAELNRRGAIRPLFGLGCSPVLVSGSKKIFLKWIGRGLRRKQIQFPDQNGPVRWTQTNSFFPVGETDLESGSQRGESKDSPAIPEEREDTPPCESH